LALRRAVQAAGTAPDRLALPAHQQRVTYRAVAGHAPGPGVRRPAVENDLHDLRNHVAGPAHDDAVADAYVQTRHLVGVVQGGVGDGHAGHLHGPQARDRRGGPGPPDLDVDGLDHR